MNSDSVHNGAGRALIAIHTHRDTYDPLQPLTPWVHAIARYKFLDYLRKAHDPGPGHKAEDPVSAAAMALLYCYRFSTSLRVDSTIAMISSTKVAGTESSSSVDCR